MSTQKLTAVVSGASRGIGKAVAEYLSQQGYTLLLLSRNEANLKKTASALGKKHHYVALDIADSKKLKSAISDFLSQVGHIDLLFNSAGYVKRGTSTLPEEEFMKMIMTNLVGVFNTINAVVPSMKARKKGYIFTVASSSGKIARAPLGGYSASKFGIIGYCESLHKELVSCGISVTTICPNLVDTEMTADVDMPRDQMLQVSDVVKTVDYLLSLSPSVSIKEMLLQCKTRVIQHESY